MFRDRCICWLHMLQITCDKFDVMRSRDPCIYKLGGIQPHKTSVPRESWWFGVRDLTPGQVWCLRSRQCSVMYHQTHQTQRNCLAEHPKRYRLAGGFYSPILQDVPTEPSHLDEEHMSCSRCFPETFSHPKWKTKPLSWLYTKGDRVLL